jgi:hypothetical protein
MNAMVLDNIETAWGGRRLLALPGTVVDPDEKTLSEDQILPPSVDLYARLEAPLIITSTLLDCAIL